ncbi:hypothetical protein [Methylomonas fluvii]|uniref:Uncharacterized protein n=1 Tax=Methylomonas fluvii TaxID=1854564 RepID=A0ABR9DJ84_9GAMM|nr:hypothetical protein [Methylomonas fluvii]MBD9363163.1 hypothetical protein [Methylomonas fluvii]CAD6876410.1 hypothetical protein [Methylomonas fluvii]
MNNINRFLLSGALLAFFGLAQPCFAGIETPRIDQRQENQERRIEQGEASGALTNREANRLEHQQMRIERQEAAAKADGVVTAGERARLTHQQNKASRNIARKKHNLRRD